LWKDGVNHTGAKEGGLGEKRARGKKFKHLDLFNSIKVKKLVKKGD